MLSDPFPADDDDDVSDAWQSIDSSDAAAYREEEDDGICPSFSLGDHVYQDCEFVAGVPYQHHGIVLSAAQEPDGEWKLCIADFTCEGSDKERIAAGSGAGSFQSSSNSPRQEQQQDVDTLVAEQPNNRGRKGLRIIYESSDRWKRVQYYVRGPGAPTLSPPELVRARVQFLLTHPDLVPEYSLLNANCECVAVWCKTGEWTTLQCQDFLGNTALKAAASNLWIVGLVQILRTTVPAVHGATKPLLAHLAMAGAIATGSSALCLAHAQNQWKDQTQQLNKAFDQEYDRRVETGWKTLSTR